MYKLICLIAISLLLPCSRTTAQSAQKTLVKSFNLLGADAVTLNLDGRVDLQSWSQKSIRIQMKIEIKNKPESLLKGMIMAGRYNLESSVQKNVLIIDQPAFERKVKLKSGELIEHISYLIHAPEHVHIEVNNTTSSSTTEKVFN